MLSPMSTGLFHKAISQSGSALKIWALSRNTLQQSRELSSAMGCPTFDTKAMIDCLKKVDARKLVSYHLSSMV